MRRIRVFPAALAVLCLLWILPAPAEAWNSDAQLVFQEEGKRVYLTLEGLEDQVFGLQLELTLEGSCPDTVFSPEVRGAYVPDCRVEEDRETTTVTIYMSAVRGSDPINDGRRLYLGYLEPGESYSLPDRVWLMGHITKDIGYSIFPMN